MIVNPTVGMVVQVWYRTKPKRKGLSAPADSMPLHGKIGTVKFVARGPGPRNHGVLINGLLWAIPCGNLRTINEKDER